MRIGEAVNKQRIAEWAVWSTGTVLFVVGLAAAYDVAASARTNPGAFGGAVGATIGVAIRAYWDRRTAGRRAAMMWGLLIAGLMAGWIVLTLAAAAILHPWASREPLLTENVGSLLLGALTAVVVSVLLQHRQRVARSLHGFTNLGLLVLAIGLVVLAVGGPGLALLAGISVLGGFLIFASGLLWVHARLRPS